MSSVEMMPQYSTKLFTEIYDNANDFYADYTSNGITPTISEANAKLLFYLLYGRYGNNPIANWDETQFKYKLFSIVFMYGPTWEKRLDIQSKLRNLSEDELMKGSKAIHNHAFNPSTAPTTQTLTELEYIDNQNTTNYKRSKLDAYTMLLELLETDVTEEFLGKFKVCFKQFVAPEKPLIFVTENDDEED